MELAKDLQAMILDQSPASALHLLSKEFHDADAQENRQGEADQKIEDEVVDVLRFAAEVLEEIEIWPALLIHGHNLTINHGAIWEIAQGFDKMRVLVIEQFVPPREQVHPAIRFDGHSPVSIEFNFEDPIRAVRQFRDGGAVHRFDEVGFSFRERSKFTSHLVPLL